MLIRAFGCPLQPGNSRVRRSMGQTWTSEDMECKGRRELGPLWGSSKRGFPCGTPAADPENQVKQSARTISGAKFCQEAVPAANAWPEPQSCGMGLGSVGEAGMGTSREGPRNRLIQRRNSGWVCFDERFRLWAYTRRRDRMEVDDGQAGPGRCVDVTRVGEGHPKAPQLEL